MDRWIFTFYNNHSSLSGQWCWSLVSVEAKQCTSALAAPPWSSNRFHCMFRLIVLLGNESSSTQVVARGDGTSLLSSSGRSTLACGELIAVQVPTCGTSWASSHVDISKILFANVNKIFLQFKNEVDWLCCWRNGKKINNNWLHIPTILVLLPKACVCCSAGFGSWMQMFCCTSA